MGTLIGQLRSSLKLAVVIVSTKTGQSIKGALVDQRRDALVLRAAAIADFDGPSQDVTWHTLDGDIVIPMENVDFWQDGLPAGMLDTVADRTASSRKRS